MDLPVHADLELCWPDVLLDAYPRCHWCFSTRIEIMYVNMLIKDSNHTARMQKLDLIFSGQIPCLLQNANNIYPEQSVHVHMLVSVFVGRDQSQSTYSWATVQFHCRFYIQCFPVFFNKSFRNLCCTGVLSIIINVITHLHRMDSSTTTLLTYLFSSSRVSA